MLSTEPKDLLKYVNAGFSFMKQFLVKRKELIRSMAGPHYRADNDSTKTPENYAFSYKQFVHPQMLFGDPQCKFKSAHTTNDAYLADAMTVAVNRWSLETGLVEQLDAVVDDSFVGYGIVKIGLRQVGWYKGEGLSAVQGDFEQATNEPFVVRIDPRDFFCDPEGSAWTQKRFFGDRFERDLDDVKMDDTYDEAARNELIEKAREARSNVDPFDNQKYIAADEDRKRIVLYDIYLPEHGKIITIAELGSQEGESRNGVKLREEQWFGPDEGCYYILGLETVPGEPIPTSPLIAMWDEFLEINEHSRAGAKAAESFKRIGVFSPAAKEDAERIQKAKPGDMVPVADPNAVKDFEIGGASDKQLNFLQFLRNKFESQLGFTDAQRGKAGSNVTATAAQIAGQSADLRVQKMQDRLRRFIQKIYRGVAWYMWHADGIKPMQLAIEDPNTGEKQYGEMQFGQWNGGFVNGQWVPPNDPGNFTDYNLDVSPKTMTKQDDAIEIAQAQQDIELAMKVTQIFQNPGVVNWRALIDALGNARGERDYSSIFFSPMFAQQLGPGAPNTGMQMPQQQGMMGGMQQPPMTPQGMAQSVTSGATTGTAYPGMGAGMQGLQVA